MTLIKERAIKMIQRMPEDNMLYVINILQNLEAMSIDKRKDTKKAQMALTQILNMEKRLPADFDPNKELQEAREEKYSNFG
nr:dihydrodipicolinate reductase [uncultured Schaedlerella sp.]